jgi:heptosyltransferase-1
MKILIIKPSSLGDVIHALRIVAQIKKSYPQASIDWVIRNGLEGILHASGIVDHLLIFNRGKGFFDYLGLIAEIRKREYDYVLDIQGLLRSAIIAGFSKGKNVFGVADGREGSVFFYKTVGESNRSKQIHAIDRLVPFLEIFKVKESESGMRLDFKDSALSEATQKKLNQSSDYLLLFPESRRSEKEWPFFSNLAEELNTSNHEDIVIAGDRKDGTYEKFKDLRGEIEINELPVLIKNAKMVISNDSAPLHIASSLGKPAISLFGPTDPVKYGYYPACSPLNGLIRAGDGILKKISVERVVQEYEELLGASKVERKMNQ